MYYLTSLVRRYLRWLALPSLALLLLLAVTLPLLADPGDLDSTFDTNGVKITFAQSINGDQDAGAVVVLDDGTLVIAANGTSNGTATQTQFTLFGTDGTLLGGANPFDASRVNDMILQDDGKIVAVGSRLNLGQNQARDFFHVRVTRIGNSFAIQEQQVPGTSLFDGSDDEALAVVKVSNGYVVGGYTRYDNMDHPVWILLNDSMQLDTTVGNNGRVLPVLNTFGVVGDARIVDLDVQPNGKILAVGYGTAANGGKYPLAMRFNANGTLDNSFDQDGVLFVVTNPAVDFPGVAIAYVPNDSTPEGLIAMLTYGPNQQGTDLRVALHNAQDGSIISQPVVIDFNGQFDVATSMVVSPENDWLIVGATSRANNSEATPADSALARVLLPKQQAPTLDTDFGNNGTLLVDLPAQEGGSANERIQDLVLQADGKIVAVGLSKQPGQQPGQALLARFENSTSVQLGINKAVSAPALKPGDTISYTLAFGTNSPNATMILTDILPSQIVSATYEIAPDMVVTETGSSDYVWEVFLPDGNGYIIISGYITDTIATDTVITNQAAVAIGGSEAQSQIRPTVIDVTPPDTSFAETPPNPDTDVTPSFTFAGNDGSGSGVKHFECSVDGGIFSICDNPFATEVNGGEHSVAVRAVDHVGYTDATPVTYTWSVETMIITPTESSSQTFGGSEGVTTTITVPPGALNLPGELEIGFSPVVTTNLPAAPDNGGLVFGFSIDLVVDGDVQDEVDFTKPITLSIAYDGDLVTDPTKIQLFYLNSENQWASDGISITEPVGNPLIVTISHLTTFGLVEVSDELKVFLPQLEQAVKPEE